MTKGRVSKERLNQIVDGANTLVDELRAKNEEYERTHSHPPVVDERAYEELRFELLRQFLKVAR